MLAFIRQKCNQDVRTLLDGDFSRYNSVSEADMALCNHLAFWCRCDATMMDGVFRLSGLMRAKWDRRQSGSTYGALTIQKAISSCPNVYSGNPDSARVIDYGDSDWPGETPAPERPADPRFANYEAAYGRAYEGGMDDFYEAQSIFCYIFKEYDFNFLYGRNGINSLSKYLTDLYGEDAVFSFMLFPDTIEDKTGKTWDEHKADWMANLAEKFDGVEIPDWVFEEQE